jgi:hypothetical protein
MDTNAPKATPQDGVKDFRLSASQRRLLDEALALLIDTRSRALDVAVQVSRRRGSASPMCTTFNYPRSSNCKGGWKERASGWTTCFHRSCPCLQLTGRAIFSDSRASAWPAPHRNRLFKL